MVATDTCQRRPILRVTTSVCVEPTQNKSESWGQKARLRRAASPNVTNKSSRAEKLLVTQLSFCFLFYCFYGFFFPLPGFSELRFWAPDDALALAANRSVE